jgi:hypothetical protein
MIAVPVYPRIEWRDKETPMQNQQVRVCPKCHSPKVAESRYQRSTGTAAGIYLDGEKCPVWVDYECSDCKHTFPVDVA